MKHNFGFWGATVIICAILLVCLARIVNLSSFVLHFVVEKLVYTWELRAWLVVFFFLAALFSFSLKPGNLFSVTDEDQFEASISPMFLHFVSPMPNLWICNWFVSTWCNVWAKGLWLPNSFPNILITLKQRAGNIPAKLTFWIWENFDCYSLGLARFGELRDAASPPRLFISLLSADRSFCWSFG